MIKRFTIFTICILITVSAMAILKDSTSYISTNKTDGTFTQFDGSEFCPILISSTDFAGVVRAVGDLQEDIFKVTGKQPTLLQDEYPTASSVMIAGNLGES